MARLTSKRPGRRERPADLPKFTYGLEGKLESLIGEPIALAQKVVRPKFETETSTNEGCGVRYTYHTEKHLSYVDPASYRDQFPWDKMANNTMFYTTPPPVIQRLFNFRVDLYEDLEGKLKSFSFALQVSQ